MTIIRVVAVAGVIAIAGGAGVLYAGFGAFLPWREEAEANRLFDLAAVSAGQTVAEIGAGGGRFTFAAARRVGPSGRIYATELDEAKRAAIAARAARDGLSQVTIITAAPLETNLPDGCCDAVFMRNVYHHVREPESFARSVSRAVRAGGRLVVMDFEPGALWFHGGRPSEASARRPGHGVAMTDAIAELRSAGFIVEQQIPRWSGPMWLVLLRRAA
jgi:SAM-dependent methyltransferase